MTGKCLKVEIVDDFEVSDKAQGPRLNSLLAEDVLRAVQAQTEAYNRGDAAAFLEFLAEDRIVMTPNQESRQGRTSLADMQDLFDQAQHRADVRVEEIVAEGDWAFEWGTGVGSLSPKTASEHDDPAGIYRYNYLRIWRRSAEGWKVARSIWNGNASKG